MLHSLHDSGLYQFIYAAMIGDVNLKARGRLDVEYNMAATPSCFFDGGHSVYVGGPLEDSVYINRIVAAGQRPVPPVNLQARVDWLGGGQLSVLVSVGHNVPANQAPDLPSAPVGPSQGTPETTYQFTSSGVDADQQALEYQFDWGDGTQSAWTGPITSGQDCVLEKSWPDENVYDVRVRVRDPWGEMTDWSPALTVDIGGCCTGPSVGNLDGSLDNEVTLGDLTIMIDHLFISLSPLACQEEGNLDLSPDGDVSLGDLTVLIDNLFISLSPLPPCP